MNQKKYLVIADSHGHLSYLEPIVPLLDQVDGVLHLGDHIDDLKALMVAKPNKSAEFWRGVRGNCDEVSSGPLELVIDHEGYRVLLAHGHRYDVKSSLLNIYHRALELEVKGVIFGHSHMPITTEEGGVVFHNPGSIALPKGGSKRSYSILTIDTKGISFNHYTL